jgi:thioredoxin 1
MVAPGAARCSMRTSKFLLQLRIRLEARVRRLSIGFSFLLLIFVYLAGTVDGQESPAASYAPLEQWRLAVLGGDAAALTRMFVTSPPPQIKSADGKEIATQDEVNFWAAWKAKGLSDVRVEILQEQNPQPNVHVVVAQVTMSVKTDIVIKKYYVGMAQAWVQVGDAWRIAYIQRQDATRLKQPTEKKDLYPASADAKTEIAEAVHRATGVHKRVLVVFGANWCYDCHVLDEAFHSPEISPTMEKSFEMVHVDIGQMDKNMDVAKQYDVPLDRGVPAIAVLESDGKLLFSQKRGEFEAARSMAPEDILDFLNKWKPSATKN